MFPYFCREDISDLNIVHYCLSSKHLVTIKDQSSRPCCGVDNVRHMPYRSNRCLSPSTRIQNASGIGIPLPHVLGHDFSTDFLH